MYLQLGVTEICYSDVSCGEKKKVTRFPYLMKTYKISVNLICLTDVFISSAVGFFLYIDANFYM